MTKIRVAARADLCSLLVLLAGEVGPADHWTALHLGRLHLALLALPHPLQASLLQPTLKLLRQDIPIYMC